MPPRQKADPITEPTEVTGEIVQISATREQLHQVDSWEAALRLSQELHGDVISITDTDLADGFRKATDADKDRMIGVPILIIEWGFSEGDFEDEFTIMRVIVKEASGESTKWIITDGGTGINRDLHDFTKKTGRKGGLTVPKGLRVSRYRIDSETKQTVSKREEREILARGGKTEPAATYYLDSSL